MPKCDIIIPVWNQLEDTKSCVESVRSNTEFPYRLIIVDNASNEETRQYLDSLKKGTAGEVTILRNEVNEGFIKAVNKAISASSSEYVCVLNNDTTVTKGWITELVNVINKDPSIGIVNPSSNTLGQRLPKGMTPEEYVRRSEPERGRYVELGNAFGFCMFMRRKLFDEIGLFDERYGMGNYEDTDFSMRAREKGYKSVRAIASYVYHKEKQSFNLLKNFKKDFEKNKRTFEAKWGKTKRIFIVMRDINEGAKDYLRKILIQHSKGKSWIYIISPFFETRQFFESFSNLTFYHYGHFFYLSAFLKIASKKKGADIVYADSDSFLNLLERARVFHGAELKKIKEAIK